MTGLPWIPILWRFEHWDRAWIGGLNRQRVDRDVLRPRQNIRQERRHGHKADQGGNTEADGNISLAKIDSRFMRAEWIAASGTSDAGINGDGADGSTAFGTFGGQRRISHPCMLKACELFYKGLPCSGRMARAFNVSAPPSAVSS